MSARVFLRASEHGPPPVAVRASGSTITDADGRTYLDAAGGAIVVNVGHGRESVARVMAEQAGTGRLCPRLGVHDRSRSSAGSRALGPYLPMDDAAVYPVSGGSEAVETALKMARAYHAARGETDRWIVIGALGLVSRQHPGRPRPVGAATRSGGRTSRGWAGFAMSSAAYPYRAGDPGAMALGTAEDAAAELERMLSAAGPRTVAAFIAEPIVGATLAAAVPPDGYWAAIAEVLRRHGVLLIMDEVMTGFGRTGRWFGGDHWDVRPDMLVAAKGASSGYWPLGFVAAAGHVADTP